MTVRSRLFSNDEEQGKRNEDEKIKPQLNGWLPGSPRAPIFRKRRILGLIVACLCTWVFIHNIPNLGPQDKRYLNRYGRGRARPLDREPADNGEDLWRKAQEAEDDEPVAPDMNTQERSTEVAGQDFDGPIRFYYLAASLHAAAKIDGQRASNRNVLFAAADLKSVADLIPMACEMGRWRRNHVHVAVMGRDAVPLEEIKRINSAEDEMTCPISWHDARPDFPERSTNHRMEVSVAGALGHIENFMHPQAIVSNYPEHEDNFFVQGVNRKTKELHQTHIELSKGTSQSLSWLTRLDAVALHNWHVATIDIIVQAPKDTSSNIVRLLKSLERADYGGFLPPKLTIELPPKLNQDTMMFLDEFQWPPRAHQNHLPYHEMTLHRRIPNKRLTDYEASTRFMESFYPYDTMDSHVLVLSPQAELSPTFFHYLKYHMLEYRYSGAAPDLFGISLETPSFYLNGSESFSPPKAKSRNPSGEGKEVQTPFLWQAPNTGAALIFADKWIELHSFLTQFFIASVDPKTESYFNGRQKLVTERLPSWAEYLLDLMRARGYYMLYPASISETSGGTSLVVLHNEMYQVPEEFLKVSSKQDAGSNNLATGDVLEGSEDEYLATHHVSSEKDTLNIERPLLRNLLAVLPPLPLAVTRPSGDEDSTLKALPPLYSLPLLDNEGVILSSEELQDRSNEIAVTYRQRAGGCAKAQSEDAEVIHGNAEDLFCVGTSDSTNVHAKPKKPATSDKHSDRSPVSSSEPSSTQAEIESDADDATPTKPHFRGTGAAAIVNAAVDPENYAATAIAGFKEKLNKQEYYEDDMPALKFKDGIIKDEGNAVLSEKNLQGEEGSGVKGSTSSWSRADDETEAERARNIKPVMDEREYERTDEDAPEKPKPKETVIDRPTEAGSRPDHTDEPSDVDPGISSSKRAGNQAQAPSEGDRDDVRSDQSRLPEEARDAAIGGKVGRVARKGRIGGWDVGGYDEDIIDEKAAAAGRLDFAKGRGRKSEDQIKRDLAAGRPEHAQQREAKEPG